SGRLRVMTATAPSFLKRTGSVMMDELLAKNTSVVDGSHTTQACQAIRLIESCFYEEFTD
ncbi:MAG: hypothetical protein VW907_07825, partial [Opitutae bacterium]